MMAASKADSGGLLKDLAYLRKSSGLTLTRLSRARSVVLALGGYDIPPETLLERLLSAVRSLPQRSDRPTRDALLAALGAAESGQRDLSARRAAFAIAVNRAPYTVHEWEDEALAELALRLLTRYYAGAGLPADLPMPHGGFLLRTLTIQTTIHDRRFTESRQSRELISLVEGAKGFIYGTYSPTLLHDLAGCRLYETRTAPGGVLHELHFPQPLRRGQPHRFSFTEQVPAANDTSQPEIDFAGQTFETPTLAYRQVVRFEGELPYATWHYDKLSRIERPGKPHEELQGVTVDCTIYDLYGGLCAGVAWQWS